MGNCKDHDTISSRDGDLNEYLEDVGRMHVHKGAATKYFPKLYPTLHNKARILPVVGPCMSWP